jgi:tetratricopeptide (TPR) repeat protein
VSALALSAALALAASAGAPAGDPAARLREADRLQLAGDLDAAAAEYAALAAEGQGGATLHLNRGNALLRAGRRGEAIASYLRALREDPLDADAAANLALARAAAGDRAAGPPRPLRSRVAARTPDLAAAAALAVPWTLLWLALGARRVSRRARARRWLGAASLALAAAAGLGAALLAARDAERSRAAAVVVVPSAPARERPEAALRAAFEVAEGTELDLLEVRGDHARVRLGSGREGWVPLGALERV